MALAPSVDITLNTDEQDIQTSRTYKLSDNRIIGMIDNIEALEQAIYLILNTERFNYLIYDQSYGIEKNDILNRNYTNEFIETEYKRVATEALLEDERVLEVKEFAFDFSNDFVNISFTVVSIFGKIDISREEIINV